MNIIDYLDLEEEYKNGFEQIWSVCPDETIICWRSDCMHMNIRVGNMTVEIADGYKYISCKTYNEFRDWLHSQFAMYRERLRSSQEQKPSYSEMGPLQTIGPGNRVEHEDEISEMWEKI